MPRENGLTDEDYSDFTDLLSAAEEQESRLSPFEADFLQDMIERNEDWGRGISLSPAQWKVIENLRRKYDL